MLCEIKYRFAEKRDEKLATNSLPFPAFYNMCRKMSNEFRLFFGLFSYDFRNLPYTGTMAENLKKEFNFHCCDKIHQSNT